MPSLVPTNLLVARKLLRLSAIAVLAMVVALLATATATATASGGEKAKTKKRALAGSTGLAATAVDSSHVKLQWSAVQGAAFYRILRGGLVVGQTATTTYTDSLLWPRTTYSYEVDAVSSAGAKIKAPTGQGTTNLLPASGFPRPFPAASIWNSPLGSAPVAANSSALMTYFLAHSPHPNMTLHAWGVAVSETHASDSTFLVPCIFYSNCTLGAFGAFAIPVTAAPDPSADGYLAVVDPSAQREWDMWQAKSSGASWSASAGAALSTTGNGTAPEGTASGDAANFPLLGGIVRPEEILQGHIDHALVFGMPGVSRVGHVCPATHNDGSSSDPNALMEGTRLQLDPSVKIDSLPIPAWEKPIARAMQVYGMYLRDTGGSFVIYAENPVARGYDAWSKAGVPSGDSVSLAGIPWAKLRVISPPAC
jgi:hypothetical protein